jgi:hypothetical protein
MLPRPLRWLISLVRPTRQTTPVTSHPHSPPTGPPSSTVPLRPLHPHGTGATATCVHGSIRQLLYRYVVVQAEPNPDLPAATNEAAVSSRPSVPWT